MDLPVVGYYGGFTYKHPIDIYSVGIYNFEYDKYIAGITWEKTLNFHAYGVFPIIRLLLNLLQSFVLL